MAICTPTVASSASPEGQAPILRRHRSPTDPAGPLPQNPHPDHLQLLCLPWLLLKWFPPSRHCWSSSHHLVQLPLLQLLVDMLLALLLPFLLLLQLLLQLLPNVPVPLLSERRMRLRRQGRLASALSWVLQLLGLLPRTHPRYPIHLRRPCVSWARRRRRVRRRLASALLSVQQREALLVHTHPPPSHQESPCGDGTQRQLPASPTLFLMLQLLRLLERRRPLHLSLPPGAFGLASSFQIVLVGASRRWHHQNPKRPNRRR